MGYSGQFWPPKIADLIDKIGDAYTPTNPPPTPDTSSFYGPTNKVPLQASGMADYDGLATTGATEGYFASGRVGTLVAMQLLEDVPLKAVSVSLNPSLEAGTQVRVILGEIPTSTAMPENTPNYTVDYSVILSDQTRSTTAPNQAALVFPLDFVLEAGKKYVLGVLNPTGADISAVVPQRTNAADDQPDWILGGGLFITNTTDIDRLYKWYPYPRVAFDFDTIEKGYAGKFPVEDLDTTGASEGDILRVVGGVLAYSQEPPEQFDEEVTVSTLAVGEARTIEVPIPLPRMQGVAVELIELSTQDAQIEIWFYGSKSAGGVLSKQTYHGLARSSNGFSDLFQNWSHRAYDGAKKIYMVVQNVGAVQASFKVHIVAEPF